MIVPDLPCIKSILLEHHSLITFAGPAVTCGSQHNVPNLPFFPGHEGVGIVEQVGPGVITVKEGDRVAIPWLGYACGTCEYCVSGWENLCEQQLDWVLCATCDIIRVCCDVFVMTAPYAYLYRGRCPRDSVARNPTEYVLKRRSHGLSFSRQRKHLY